MRKVCPSDHCTLYYGSILEHHDLMDSLDDGGSGAIVVSDMRCNENTKALYRFLSATTGIACAAWVSQPIPLDMGGTVHVWDKVGYANGGEMRSFDLFWSTERCPPRMITNPPMRSKMHEIPQRVHQWALRDILELHKENRTVVDLKIGAGGVALACAQIGIKYVGFDIVSERVDAAHVALKDAWAFNMFMETA